jgi:hypothetical protein
LAIWGYKDRIYILYPLTGQIVPQPCLSVQQFQAEKYTLLSFLHIYSTPRGIVYNSLKKAFCINVFRKIKNLKTFLKKIKPKKLSKIAKKFAYFRRAAIHANAKVPGLFEGVKVSNFS